jgi:ABC-2 type transport system permease protein
VFTVVMLTMYTGVGLNTDVSQGVFSRFRSLPIWRPAVLVGSLLGDAVRYTLAATVVIGLGLALGFRPGGGVAGVVMSLALVLVFAFSLSWGVHDARPRREVPGCRARREHAVAVPTRLREQPVRGPWNHAGMAAGGRRCQPVQPTVSAVRDLMDGSVPAGQIGWVLVACAAIIAVFAPLTMRLYRTKPAAAAA